jgi:hypothetical protein
LIYEFNPSNNQWAQKTSLPGNHIGGGSFSFSQLPCVFGGQQYYPASPGSYWQINSAWQYKPECSTSYSAMDVTACSSFTMNGQTYNNSGIFIQNLSSASGCDSILTINLNINYPPSTEVLVNENSMTAVETNSFYQWLDCENNLTAILGATNEVFQVINSGSYALSISNGLCADTSSCFSFTSLKTENNRLSEYRVYPNPSSSYVFIESDSNYPISCVTIYDITGRGIKSILPTQSSTIQILLPSEPGAYNLIIETAGGGKHTHKIIKT